MKARFVQNKQALKAVIYFLFPIFLPFPAV